MAMIQIGGVGIAPPKSFSVTISDLDNESERNAAGDLIRDRVAVKRKLSLEWPALTTQQISAILTKVTDVFFTCTYPDPQTGTSKTITCYVGDRTAPLYKNGLWESLKMDFVER